MKKYIKGLIMIIMLACLIMGQGVFAAVTSAVTTNQQTGSSNNAKLDAVLVIDASGSMQETDPNKLGLEGVKLFVDMLSSSGNQAGIVTYGAQADQIYPMTDITSQNDREKIKDFVSGIARNLEYTDISTGLGKAVQMLDQRSKSNGGSPIIIVFTDGNNAIGGVANRTYEDIDNDIADQIKMAQAAGYPVYTIGLNDNGKLNEDYLKNISSQTGGLSFATKDPDELPDILTQIFAAYSNLKVQSMPTVVGTGDFEEVTINIPNGNVLEANIAATSTDAITFKLKDPAGNEIAIPSGNVSLHEANSYHLLKITKPIEGDWTLYVKGVAGDKINIDLVYNYDIDVTIEPLSNTQFNKGDMLDISAYLSLQGNAVSDDSLYKNASAYVILTDASGSQTKTPLTVNGHKFEGSCQLKDEGSFNVSVLIEDNSFTRESSPVAITVGSSSPVGNQNMEEQKAPEEKQDWVKYVIIGISILLIAALLFVLLKKVKDAKRPLVGQMVVEVKDNTTGKLTPPQYKKLNIFQGKVSLHALLQFAPEYKEAENILLKSAPGDKVLLLNHSNYTVEKAGRALKIENGLELKKGDKLCINMADCGVTIQLEYRL